MMFLLAFFGCSDATYYKSDTDVGLKIEISEKLKIESSQFIVSKNSDDVKILGMMLKGSLGRTGYEKGKSFPQLKMLKYYKNGAISAGECSFFAYPSDDAKTFLKVREWNKDNPNNKLETDSNAYIGQCQIGSWSTNFIERIYLYQ